MQLSIVIPTRNRVRLVEQAVRSLIDQDIDRQAYEIIIIDDGSTDNTVEALNSLKDQTALPRVEVVSEPHKGANAARNLGIIKSSSDWVFFMDDDEIAPPDFITKLLHRMHLRTDLDGLGGPCRDFGRAKYSACPDCNWATVTIGNGRSRHTERLLGGNMLIRKSAFSRIGAFSETLRGAGDEVEWFMRGRGKLSLEYDEDLWLWHRRDGFSFLDICSHAFKQGMGLPEYRNAISQGRRVDLAKAIRSLGHAIRKRCIRGVILFFKELGAIYWCLNNLVRKR